MNLFDMARRRDANLVMSGDVRTKKRSFDGAVWRGLDLVPSEQPQLQIRNAVQWFPLSERPHDCGWFGALHGWLAPFRKNRATLSLWFEDPARPGQPVAPPMALTLGDALKPLPLPWPADAAALPPDAVLVIHLPAAARCRTFLAVHRMIDRQALLGLARGIGVEIGPGPQPQVLPASGVEVSYVEQMPPEDWERLYNQTGKYKFDKALWKNYRVGEAHALPVEDNTLDFIFSSHVFEHLANPLGHLAHWRTKLKPGGRILAVVPDLAGTKDYVFRPCPLSDLLAERDAGLLEPTLEHYRRWAKHRAPKSDPTEIREQGRSIHVHFFSKGNMAELLQYAVDHLGFGSFDLRHVPNHKDFHFILARPSD